VHSAEPALDVRDAPLLLLLERQRDRASARLNERSSAVLSGIIGRIDRGDVRFDGA